MRVMRAKWKHWEGALELKWCVGESPLVKWVYIAAFLLTFFFLLIYFFNKPRPHSCVLMLKPYLVLLVQDIIVSGSVSLLTTPFSLLLTFTFWNAICWQHPFPTDKTTKRNPGNDYDEAISSLAGADVLPHADLMKREAGRRPPGLNQTWCSANE